MRKALLKRKGQAYSDISREASLMLACLVPGKNQDQESFARLAAGINWGFFFAACVRHKVLMQAYNALNTLEDKVIPQEIGEKIDRFYVYENMVHGMELTSQLVRVLKAFHEKGVQAVPFKGPVLAQQIYGDFTLRQYVDLDILILRQEAEQALAVLFSQGFELEDEKCLNAGTRKAYLKSAFWIGLVKPGTNVKIDLHLDLGGIFTRRPMGLEQMGTARQKVVVAGRHLTVFPAETQLCYLCLHGAKHRWRTLDLLCCVSGLVRSQSDLDWDNVWHFSQRFGCRRVVLLGLYLAGKVLGLEVPKQAEQRIKSDKQIVTLGNAVCKKLFFEERDDLAGAEKFDPLAFKTRDGLMQMLLYRMRVVFYPTIEDFRVFRLPGRLSFLRYGLRPLRLAGVFAGSIFPLYKIKLENHD